MPPGSPRKWGWGQSTIKSFQNLVTFFDLEEFLTVVNERRKSASYVAVAMR